MIGVIENESTVKNTVEANQKIIDNHNKSAMHHEAAAMHHHEAVKHLMAGNSTMACGCNCKAKDQSRLAKKIQKKNDKKHSSIV